jgi:hypothetical protein
MAAVEGALMLHRPLATCIGWTLLWALSTTAWAQSENTPEYRERLVAEKRYAEAFEARHQALAKEPSHREESLPETGENQDHGRGRIEACDEQGNKVLISRDQ